MGWLLLLVSCLFLFFFFFKLNTAYEMRISDWISDVCSSDLDDASMLMSHPWSLAQAADYFGIDVPPAELARIQSELDAELAGIQPFTDALLCIEALQARGLKVAVCSNLARPYGAAVKRIFPALESYGFSYEIGTLKPDRRIARKSTRL